MLEVKPGYLSAFALTLPEPRGSQVYFDGLMLHLEKNGSHALTIQELETIGHKTGVSVATRERAPDHGICRIDKIGSTISDMERHFGVSFENEVRRVQTAIPDLVNRLDIPDASKQQVARYIQSIQIGLATSAEGDQYVNTGYSFIHDSVPYLLLYPISIIDDAYIVADFFRQEVGPDLIRATIADITGHELGHKVAESLAGTGDDFVFPPQVQASYFSRFPIDFSSPEGEAEQNFASIFPHVTLKESFAEYFSTWACRALGYSPQIKRDKARHELMYPFMTGLTFQELHTYTQAVMSGIYEGSPKPEEAGHEMCMASLALVSSMYKNYGLFYLFPFTQGEIEDSIRANWPKP